MKKILAFALILFLLGNMTITSNAYSYGYKTLDVNSFKSDYRITTIHIGSDVMDITENAFKNLNNLQSITVSENNPFYASYSGCLYDKYMTELICFPPALSGAVIPASVVTIGKNALHGVPTKLKQQVVEVVEEQASGNLSESDVKAPHFIHGAGGIKWKDEDGNVSSPSTYIMCLAAAVVDAATTGYMTQPQQLEEAFNTLVDNFSYERSYETPSGYWVKDYACKALSEKKGNCYGYASSFAYVATGLGYEARVCTGTVTSSLGGRTEHAWTEVKMGKKWYVFDAEMQDAKGSGYYKQTYDSYPAGPLEKTSSYTVSF